MFGLLVGELEFKRVIGESGNSQNWEKIQLNSKLKSSFAPLISSNFYICMLCELLGVKIKESKFN